MHNKGKKVLSACLLSQYFSALQIEFYGSEYCIKTHRVNICA
jgi:hypothetical protein